MLKLKLILKLSWIIHLTSAVPVKCSVTGYQLIVIEHWPGVRIALNLLLLLTKTILLLLYNYNFMLNITDMSSKVTDVKLELMKLQFAMRWALTNLLQTCGMICSSCQKYRFLKEVKYSLSSIFNDFSLPPFTTCFSSSVTQACMKCLVASM